MQFVPGIGRVSRNVGRRTCNRLVDFLDRVERGERIIRVESLVVSTKGKVISSVLSMVGLAKPGLARKSGGA